MDAPDAEDIRVPDDTGLARTCAEDDETIAATLPVGLTSCKELVELNESVACLRE